MNLYYARKKDVLLKQNAALILSNEISNYLFLILYLYFGNL